MHPFGVPEVFAGPSLGPGVGFADTPATVFDASGVEVSALRRATVFDASGVGVSFAPGRLQPTVFDAYDVGASIPMSRLLHIRFSIPADTRPELELFAV
ncbi:MAG: hypothetical protein ABI718_14530, partial [Acidobacteriota bacterium]